MSVLRGRRPSVGYNSAMSTEAVAVGMVPDELKHEPRSKGLNTPRKKKPKELAVITECCTGCAGSPACVEYCPVEDCMFWVPDEDHPPFGRIQLAPAHARGYRADRARKGCWHECRQPGQSDTAHVEPPRRDQCLDPELRFGRQRSPSG